MRLLAAILLAATLVLDRGGLRQPTRSRATRCSPANWWPAASYDPATHKGKVTVVNFWGSWCAPCRAEMPGLVKAYDDLKNDDVAFLGINVRDPNLDQAKAFVDQYKVPFPSIRDTSEQAGARVRRGRRRTSPPR